MQSKNRRGKLASSDLLTNALPTAAITKINIGPITPNCPAQKSSRLLH